jgi:glycosyltransferase involved in cell wall biosynthesis
MKNVLLLYPEMLFYKISIFNKLSAFLERKGYKLIIWYTKIYDPNKERSFRFISNTPMTRKNYTRVIKENDIEAVINILFKKDPGYLFYMFSVLKPKKLRIPVIFYGHGIDKQKDQWWRNILYNLTYFIFDGIILYTPGEKSKLWKRFHHKITFANNTLDMENLNIHENKEQIKTRYNISTPKVILTTGRLHSRKKIEILSEIFIRNYKDSPDVSWVLVGPDLSDEVCAEIRGIKNILFLGPVYDRKKMAEIFSIADLYCVPGALGLGIVEAFYWGLPVLTTSVNHGPEAYYLRNNHNSLIAKDKQELKQMIHEILFDDEKRVLFSENAKRVFSEEATLDKMFEGFNLQLNRIFNETISTEYQKEIIDN